MTDSLFPTYELILYQRIASVLLQAACRWKTVRDSQRHIQGALEMLLCWQKSVKDQQMPGLWAPCTSKHTTTSDFSYFPSASSFPVPSHALNARTRPSWLWQSLGMRPQSCTFPEKCPALSKFTSRSLRCAPSAQMNLTRQYEWSQGGFVCRNSELNTDRFGALKRQIQNPFYQPVRAITSTPCDRYSRNVSSWTGSLNSAETFKVMQSCEFAAKTSSCRALNIPGPKYKKQSNPGMFLQESCSFRWHTLLKW